MTIIPAASDFPHPCTTSVGDVVSSAHALIAACGCNYGCPACVGPILASDETRGYSPKGAALKVLQLIAGG